jgi:hypothetical protein
MNIYQNAANQAQDEHDGYFSQRRLWTAVLLQAIEDWTSTNMRRQREAEKFLFKSQDDFARVCKSAGLEPGSILSKLQRLNAGVRHIPAFQFQQAA